MMASAAATAMKRQQQRCAALGDEDRHDRGRSRSGSGDGSEEEEIALRIDYEAALAAVSAAGTSVAQKGESAVGAPRAASPPPAKRARSMAGSGPAARQQRPRQSRLAPPVPQAPQLAPALARMFAPGPAPSLAYAAVLEERESRVGDVVAYYIGQTHAAASLLPRTRRTIVNVIYAVAGAANLELGTPGFATLLLDRFLSTWDGHVASRRALLLGLTCLVIAGKIADVDGGHCGSSGFARLLRDTLPQECRGASDRDFMRCLYRVEASVMRTLQDGPLAMPTALEWIQAATGWGDTESSRSRWLLAALLCDAFACCTECTAHRQCDVGWAAAHVAAERGAPAPPNTSRARRNALGALCRAAVALADTATSTGSADPYRGVRARHLGGPALAELAGIYPRIRALAAVPPSPSAQ